jgi:hypothetical protein
MGVLTDKHLQLLNSLLESCTATAEYCQGCIDCGIDAKPELRRNAEQLDMAKKLKAKHFPNAK